MFKASLNKIVNNCEGAVAGIVMGFDGISVQAVTKSDDIDVNTVGMEFSFVLGQVAKAAEILQVGKLDEVAIRSDNLTFIARVLSDEYFVAMAMRPNGNFGKGRFLMRVALPELRSHL